jgi:hypothetical protein
MRIFLLIACAAALVFSAWSNTPTAADARRAGTTAMSHVDMIAVAAILPVEQYDAH